MTRFMSIALALMLLAAGVVLAQKVDVEGKAWLAQFKEPPAINVSGNWNGGEWGKVILSQAEGSREVTGKGDDWRIDGVVSGKKVYLLFSDKNKVNYCAEMEAESPDSLKGQYSTGMMKPKVKLRPIVLKK